MNFASVTNKPTAFNFRRWSRKGYAVFASLGRLVRIATLKTVVSTGLACKEVTVVPFSTSSNTDDEVDDEWLLAQPEVPFASILITQILSIQTIAKTNACGVAAPACLYHKTNPVGFGRWGFLFPISHLLRIKTPLFSNQRTACPQKTFTL